MIITLNHVCKSYAGQQVLQDVSLQLQGRVVLTGPSGSGKTTLSRLLLGLESPDSGRVEMSGRLAAVFQEDRLCPGMSAFENVALVCPRGFDPEQIRTGFSALGLGPEDWQKPCAQLSGGQKRRTAILRAMLAPAEGILLDEPFKGLDPRTKQAAMSYVLKKAGERLLLVITHDEEETQFFGPHRLELVGQNLEWG